MNYRFKFSILLVFSGLVLLLLPSVQFSLSELNPKELLQKSLDEDQYFSVDQVARYIVYEDTSKLFIDLRTPEEYKEFNIPGSINIPYSDLMNPDRQGYLNQNKVQNVFYSNGDIISTNAWILTTRLGYKNNYIMKGGLNEWYKTVMESKFKGGKISAKENALFESRYKAKNIFTKLNSLPDSLKTRFVEAKRLEEAELDGGCN